MARIRIVLGAAVALAVVLAGCSREEASPEVGPPPDASGTASTEDAVDRVGSNTASEKATPSDDDTVERAGGENGQGPSAPIGPGADAPADKAPSVSLPSLPIGGNGSEPDADGVQCADVAWRGEPDTPADLVPGVRVLVTDVVFAPAVFTLVEGACGSGLPSCAGFVFQSGARQCIVAVAPARDAADPGGPYSFGLSGTVECPGLNGRQCAAFAAAAANIHDQSIDLSAPSSTSGTGDGSVGGGGQDSSGPTVDASTGSGQETPAGDSGATPPGG